MGTASGKNYLTKILHEIRLPSEYEDWSFDNDKER